MQAQYSSMATWMRSKVSIIVMEHGLLSKSLRTVAYQAEAIIEAMTSMGIQAPYQIKPNQMIKYKLHNRLGPVKIPSQKTILPNKRRPRIKRVRLSATSGN